MESKIYLLKKPAAGAARIGILYRSPPLENVQNFWKGGGSVEKPSDDILGEDANKSRKCICSHNTHLRPS